MITYSIKDITQVIQKEPSPFLCMRVPTKKLTDVSYCLPIIYLYWLNFDLLLKIYDIHSKMEHQSSNKGNSHTHANP